MPIYVVQFSPVPQSCLTVTPSTAARQASLSITNSLGVGVMKYIERHSINKEQVLVWSAATHVDARCALAARLHPG